jgi:predicted outer membrane repeat protein
VFVTHFAGVVAVPTSECQRGAGHVIDGSFKPLHALLYFCSDAGTDVVFQLQQPVVQGVWLNVSASDEKPGWDSALVYVGGNASVVIEGGRFEHNHAGYPLWLAGSTRTNISSTVITGNHQGGLKLQGNASAGISSSNITHNKAAFGAGVYAMGSSRAVFMHGTLVSNNTAQNKGGGLYAKNSASIVFGSGSAVDGNIAWQDGAGMTLEDSANASLSNCSVSHNNATGSSAGGILVSDNSTVVLDRCELLGNQAGKQGGAVALQADGDKCKVDHVFVCRPSLRMSSSSVVNNSASMQGGGLYVGPTGLAVVSQSTMRFNKARNGGAAHVHGKSSSLHAAELVLERRTLIVGNTAENAGGINVYGDDHDVDKCIVRVSDSKFAANTAVQGGGALVANARCSVVAEGAVLRDNSAGKVGGAFSASSGVSWSMAGVQIMHNTAQAAGAGYIGNHASVLIVSNSLIKGNRATHDGGAFALADTAQLRLSGGSQLVDNNAAVSGGAVAAADGASVTLDASYCRNNDAGANGGCVYLLDQAQVRLTNGSACTANTARTSGGCLCAVGNSSVHVSQASEVTANRARIGGGVALLDSGPHNDASSLHSFVTDNTATDMGDDVYVDLVNVTLAVQSIVSNTDGMLSASQLQQQGRVVGYVSRSSGAGLNVSLAVMSNGSSAGSGVRVEASVGGAYQSTGITDEKGLVVFADISPKLSPGTHTLVLAHNTVSGTPVRELFELAVRSCVRGEVNRGTSTVCDVCGPGTYSLNSTAADCEKDVCEVEADCSRGGAVLLPLHGMYQRSPAFAVFQR